jgi:hypothetical protein
VIHGVLDRVLAAGGLARRPALRTLYRMVLADDSLGFTPQIGAFLARIGAEDLQEYRAALI